MTTAETNDLITEVTQLPVQPGAAMRLLWMRAPRRYDTAMDRRTAGPELLLIDIENEEFGTTHAQVGAAALGVMRFPAEMAEAIGEHHSDPKNGHVGARPVAHRC